MFLDHIRHSLRWQLLLSLIVGVGLSLVVYLIVVDSIVDHQVESSLDDRLGERANEIAAELSEREVAAGAVAPALPFNRSDPAYFEVRDPVGRVLANSGFNGTLPVPLPLAAPAAFDLRLPTGALGRAAVVRARPKGGGEATLYVVVAEDRRSTDELSNILDAILWIGVAVILLVCSGVALLAVQRGLRPLEEVAAAAAAVSVHQSHTALPLGELPREILPLGEQFNLLLARLAEALDRERAFSENLAHELRTPLAEMRALSEVDVGSGDDMDLRANVSELGRAAVRMQNVVETLLAVARADRQNSVNAAEPLDLARLVRRCVEARSQPASDAPRRVLERLPGELWVTADTQLLEIVVMNLIDNAFDHSTGEGAIEIDWVGAQSAGALRIRNFASQLDRSDLTHLGTRWWRHRSAEDRSAGGGCGLGLSIAMMLVDVLNLSLHFELDGQQRLSVTLARIEYLAPQSTPEPLRV